MAQPTATLRAPGDVMSCPSGGERVEMQPGTMSRSGAKEKKKFNWSFANGLISLVLASRGYLTCKKE